MSVHPGELVIGPRSYKKYLMLSLLLLALTACGGRIDNFTSDATPASGIPIATVERETGNIVYVISNASELNEVVGLINSEGETNNSYKLVLKPGEYALGSDQATITNKHLEDTGNYNVNVGLSIQTDANISITSENPENRAVLVADGVVNDVIVHIAGNGNVNLENLEVRTHHATLTQSEATATLTHPVKAAIYIEGNRMNPARQVNVHDVSMINNIDTSLIDDKGSENEFSGLVVKHAHAVNVSDFESYNFFLGGISLFDIEESTVSNFRLVRDSALKRTGAAVGLISTTAATLTVRNGLIEGYYKGPFIHQQQGFPTQGNVLNLSDVLIHKDDSPMYSVAGNDYGGSTNFTNVAVAGDAGATLLVTETGPMTVANSNIRLSSYYDENGNTPEYAGQLLIFANGPVTVINSTLSNTGWLGPEQGSQLERFGFRLTD